MTISPGKSGSSRSAQSNPKKSRAANGRAAEAIALIREHHAKWLLSQGQAS
jgi:hypothetical protein